MAERLVITRLTKGQSAQARWLLNARDEEGHPLSGTAPKIKKERPAPIVFPTGTVFSIPGSNVFQVLELFAQQFDGINTAIVTKDDLGEKRIKITLSAIQEANSKLHAIGIDVKPIKDRLPGSRKSITTAWEITKSREETPAIPKPKANGSKSDIKPLEPKYSPPSKRAIDRALRVWSAEYTQEKELLEQFRTKIVAKIIDQIADNQSLDNLPEKTAKEFLSRYKPQGLNIDLSSEDNARQHLLYLFKEELERLWNVEDNKSVKVTDLMSALRCRELRIQGLSVKAVIQKVREHFSISQEVVSK